MNCPAKNNYPVTLIIVVSVLVYSVVGCRYVHNKYCVLRNKYEVESNSNFNMRISRNTIVSFTTNGIIIFMFSLGILTLKKVNMFKLEALNDYPNDIWYYALHYTIPSLSVTFVVFVYLIRTKGLRRHVWVDLCENVNVIKISIK